MRLTPQAVWAYLRRNPGVMVFLEQQLSAHNGHLLAFIVRRHAMLAMEGSVASAEFVAKVLGGQYTRTLSGAGIDA